MAHIVCPCVGTHYNSKAAFSASCSLRSSAEKIKPIWLWRGFWVCLQRSFPEVKHAAVTTATQRKWKKKQKKNMSQLCAFRCQSISKDASIISLKPLSAPLQGIQYKEPWSKQTLTLPITHDDDETVYRQFPDVHCSCWRLQAHWVGLPVPISRITPLPSLRIRFSILAANCMPDWDLRRHNWNDAGANPSRFMSHLISYFSILSFLLVCLLTNSIWASKQSFWTRKVPNCLRYCGTATTLSHQSTNSLRIWSIFRYLSSKNIKKRKKGEKKNSKHN